MFLPESYSPEIDDVVTRGRKLLIGLVKGMGIASPGRRGVVGISVRPDLHRPIGLVAEDLFAGVIEKFRGYGGRTVDTTNDSSFIVENVAIALGQSPNELVDSVAVQVHGERAEHAKRQRMLLPGQGLVCEFVHFSSEESFGSGGFSADADGHRDVLALVAEPGRPAHVHVAAVHVAPDSLALVVEEGHARRDVCALPAGEDEPLIMVSVQHRLDDVRMTPIGVSIRTEELLARVQLDATLSPEHLIDVVVVDIHNGTHVAAARSRRLAFDLVFPAQFQVAVASLYRHRPVGALGGNQHGFTFNVASENEVPEGMAQALVAFRPGPGPLPGCLTCPGVDSLESQIVDAQGVVGVEVINEPYLIHTVTVEVERKDRREPDAGNDAPAEIAPPENLSLFIEKREFQRALGKEKHLDIRIDLSVRAVHGKDRSGLSFSKINGNGSELTGRLAEFHFKNALQIEFRTSICFLCPGLLSSGLLMECGQTDHSQQHRKDLPWCFHI